MVSVYLALIVGALSLLVLYSINVHTYWKRRGIPTAKGWVPLLGHILPLLTCKLSFGQLCQKMYEAGKGYSMIGFYKTTSPVLLVREPRLIKIVLQSNFSSFHDNGLKIEPELNPLAAKNPFFNVGEAWATARKRLTYAFSGVRLKMLFAAVNGVCKKFADYLEKQLKSRDKYEVELKSLFSRFTGEVVGNAGVSIEGFCFEDAPHPGSLDEIGKLMLEPITKNGILTTLVFFVPTLNKLFKIPMVPEKVNTFIRQVVAENLEVRRKLPTPMNDFLQVMINLEKTEGDETLNEENLAADVFSFFIDGYETSSVTLSFIGYHLAEHSDVQEKLREEIVSIVAKYDGALTLDALKEMTYMDQVINESQRRYPAGAFLIKVCTEEFELRGSDGLCCRVKPGTEVIISISGLHVDPDYWTDPEVFDPDRFSDDRKQSIEKMTFLPFSEGPRMCAGMRMALLQIKACLATLLRNYKLELSPKMQLPLRLSPLYFLSLPIGGVWVYISKI